MRDIIILCHSVIIKTLKTFLKSKKFAQTQKLLGIYFNEIDSFPLQSTFVLKNFLHSSRELDDFWNATF